jgi:hypothetical protein
MKYGAGSALLNDDMARFSSCCMMVIRTGSGFVVGLDWAEAAETENEAKSAPKRKNLENDMIA